MSPTSRNVLLIGGALILIALLLLFGPFKDLTGVGEMGVESAPPVAAGPPQETEIVEPADTMDAVVAGALVGVSVFETDVAVRDATDKPSTADKADSPAPPPVANTPSRIEPRAVEEKKSSPSVSAGVPERNVADGTIPGRDPIEEAIENFDAAFTMAGVGPEVDRFPPPVAIDRDEIALAILEPSPRIILQPCDLPGSGCLSSGPIEVGPDRSGGGGIGRFRSGSPRGGTPSGEAF